MVGTNGHHRAPRAHGGPRVNQQGHVRSLSRVRSMLGSVTGLDVECRCAGSSDDFRVRLGRSG